MGIGFYRVEKDEGVFCWFVHISEVLRGQVRQIGSGMHFLVALAVQSALTELSKHPSVREVAAGSSGPTSATVPPNLTPASSLCLVAQGEDGSGRPMGGPDPRWVWGGSDKLRGFFYPAGLVHWVTHCGAGWHFAILGYPWVDPS